MSATRRRDADTIALAPFPRVDLLPPEVRAQRAARALRRRLAFGVGLVAVATSGAIVLSALSAIDADAQLEAAQDRTSALLVQQNEYAQVRSIQQQIGTLNDAQRIGVWTEIDWRDYLDRVQTSLPGGVTISNVSIDGASPMDIYPQAAVPLQGPRAATLAFVATGPNLPSIPAWLRALGPLPGFVDAVPGSVSRDEGGNYVVSMTMHIDSAAFAQRFMPVGTEPTEADGETAAPDSTDEPTEAAGNGPDTITNPDTTTEEE